MFLLQSGGKKLKPTEVIDVRREFCKSLEGLKPAYNECIDALIKFRSQHIVLVSRYIISQATK